MISVKKSSIFFGISNSLLRFVYSGEAGVQDADVILVRYVLRYWPWSKVGDDLTLQTQVSNEVASDQELRSRLRLRMRKMWRKRFWTQFLFRVTLSERGWLAVKDGVPSQATKADVLKVTPDNQSSQDGIVFRCSPAWKQFWYEGPWARRCKRRSWGRWWWTSQCPSGQVVHLQQGWRSAGGD